MQDFEILEERYALHLESKQVNCAVVNTGTAALHVVLEAMDLPSDTIVIVPEFTMYASALAVFYARLQMKFVDCDDDLLIDLDAVENILKEDVYHKIRVVMVTHVYGRTVDMKRVSEIATKYDVRIIEDACEAQASITNINKPAGTYDIGCFSFYRNKIICAEEGGLIYVNDTDLISRVRDMRSMSFGKTHDYYHAQIGFNYRMTNSQARLALTSLENVKQSLDRRSLITSLLNEKIDKNLQMSNNRNVVWVYDMKHPNADLVVKDLKHAGINARHSFKPMSIQPLFSKWKNEPCDYQNALKKSQEVFYLHCGDDFDINLIDEISNKVNTICRRH
jgi:dTDP-4-amino-4,6-dideoxygalactose transaminase